jgi:cell division septal protein FtsQ
MAKKVKAKVVRKRKKAKGAKVKRKKPFYQSKVFWFVFLSSLAVLGLLYLFIFSSVFQVKEIKIEGNERTSQEDLSNFVWPLISQKLIWETKSIFLVKSHQIEENILKNFPLIGKAKLVKKPLALLILRVKEREEFAVACNEQCFKMDYLGMVFEKTDQRQGLIIVFPNKNILVGQRAIDPSLLEQISRVEENFKNNPDVKIEEYIFYDNRIEAKTQLGPRIIFDLDNKIDNQLLKLNIVLREEISMEKLKGLDYIDVRFGNKVYYK